MKKARREARRQLEMKVEKATDSTERFGDLSAIHELTGLNQSGTKRNQNSGTKTIVKNAVKGGIIAGAPGAVVGAVVGRNKADEARDAKQ